MNTKNDIIYGEVDLDPSEFETRKVKVRITTMIDEDALNTLKKLADAQGQKYQTLLNHIVRSYVAKKIGKPAKQLSEERVRKIVREELRRKSG
jgi:hypothetical protein